jgi:hypothetical protein
LITFADVVILITYQLEFKIKISSAKAGLVFKGFLSVIKAV